MSFDEFTKEEFEAAAAEAEVALRPTIYIFQDADGNWRGGMKKGGAILQAREIGPETVLMRLITDSGQQ